MVVPILAQELTNIGRRLADSLLDTSHQLIFLALGIGEIIVGEVAIGLLELALHNIPVPL